MAYFGDPVAAGIVKNLERPGGNVTGIGGLAAGLGGKWLELLKEIVPSVSQVGILYSRFSEKQSPMMKELEVAARSLHVELQPAEAERRGPFGGTLMITPVRTAVGAGFDWATKGADALVVLPYFAFEDEVSYVAGLTQNRRIPAIFWRHDFAEAGGLAAYGANESEQLRRAAYVVDKLLKGAKPSEMPVELPKKFELTINLKTAKEIGITIPPRVLAWADRVIK
jgi:putative ABC transport system substrate-binding protein